MYIKLFIFLYKKIIYFFKFDIEHLYTVKRSHLPDKINFLAQLLQFCMQGSLFFVKKVFILISAQQYHLNITKEYP